MEFERPAAVLTAVILMLVCSTAELAGVRLEDSDEHCSGTPEVFYDGKWSAVSSRSFDIRAAMVVCRELDCGNAVSVAIGKQTSNEKWINYVQKIDCTGHESAVLQCKQQQISLDIDFVNIRTVVNCSDSVRLVDGAGLCSGRLEVKTQQSWTTVCETDFDWQDAEVVCRELGCGTPLTLQGALFGKGTLPFGSREFQCKGTETHLMTCSTSSKEEHTCTHGSAVGLTCTGPGDVSLVNGSSRCAGTVKMFHSGEWRGLNGEMWSRKEAAVVCRQLDCGSGVVANVKRPFSNEAGWSVLTDCGGSEPALKECATFVYLQTRILAAVTCSDSVKLVDGAGLCSGRLEVKSPQSWTTVCETDFDWQDAKVVCRELGCGTPIALQGALFGKGKHSFGTKEFQCKGTEKHLLTCSTSSRKKLTCTHGNAVGLTCSGPDEVRLVNGVSRCAGTVEVFHSDQWMKVAADEWTEKEATVVCRRLDCGTQVASLVVESGTEESGTEETRQGVWINCKGSESLLQECTVLRVSYADLVIQVVCSDVLEQPTISLSTPIRVSRGLQRSKIFRNHSFTITCSTRQQYPGGSFYLKLPWTNRSHTQTAVNHSASFLFPAANDSHQGNYSCVYENQVSFEEFMYRLGIFSFLNYNMSSESEHLFLTITDFSLHAFIIRILLVPFLLLISCLLIFLVFKKCGHILISKNTSSGAAAVQYENIELVSLQQNKQNVVDRESGEELPTDLEQEEEEGQQLRN